MKVLSSFLWGSEMMRVSGTQRPQAGGGVHPVVWELNCIQFEGPLRKKMINIKSDMKVNIYLE